MKKKKSFFVVIWDAIYPVLLYYALLLVVRQLMFWIFTKFDATESLGMDYPLTSVICAIVAIPILFTMYCNDRNGGGGMRKYMAEHKPHIAKKSIGISVIAIVAMVLIGAGLANMIMMLPFTSTSEGYKQASEALYSGTIFTEILGSAIFIPLLEELVYRGVVQNRMRMYYGAWVSILIQAILFGLLHGNIVQGLFGFLMGIGFGILVERTGHMYPAVAGHMAYNLYALLKTELNWMEWSTEGSVLAWVVSGVTLLLGVVVLVAFYKLVNKTVSPD